LIDTRLRVGNEQLILGVAQMPRPVLLPAWLDRGSHAFWAKRSAAPTGRETPDDQRPTFTLTGPNSARVDRQLYKSPDTTLHDG
jgi:hypothetical protein